MIRDNEYAVKDKILVQHVLLSVFDKGGIDELVGGILESNPDAKFYSTGGTGRKVQEALGDKAATNYVPVEDFTGCPEMEGGLVKTLHPKIHAGILGERGNPNHERYLGEDMAGFGQGEGIYFDAVVVNFYDFNEAMEKAREDQDTDLAEKARTHIDIGGPTMVVAAAKNWHGVAVLTNPGQYARFTEDVAQQGGTTAKQRFELAQEAVEAVSEYRAAIDDGFGGLDYKTDVEPHLKLGN